MVRNINFLLLLLFTIAACSPGKQTLIENQLNELDQMYNQAATIVDSLNTNSGKEYFDKRDKYYDLMRNRTEKAMQYLNATDPDKLTINDLKKLAKIADIAQDEQKIIDVLKILFNRFPDTKQDKRLLQLYFPNAYLLEPEEIEKYVDINIFTPNEQLNCYYALAIGFSEYGNIEQAKKYKEKANALLKMLTSERVQRNTIPVTQIVGMRSFIEYKLGNTSEAFKIIDDAKKIQTDAYSIKQFELYENRLRVLGEKVKSIQYQFWLGTKQPIDLSTLKGNVVLLDFFTWSCETCTGFLPSLFRIKEQFNNSNFKIVGISQYVGSYECYQNISELREYQYLRDHYYIQRKLSWPVSISRNDGLDAKCI